jgi:hypothetical protein
MLWRNFVGYSELLAEWNNGLIRKSIVAGINIRCGACGRLGPALAIYLYCKKF